MGLFNEPAIENDSLHDKYTKLTDEWSKLYDKGQRSDGQKYLGFFAEDLTSSEKAKLKALKLEIIDMNKEAVKLEIDKLSKLLEIK